MLQSYKINIELIKINGLTMVFRFLMSGESHGKCLTAIIEGVPAGFALKSDDINIQLSYGTRTAPHLYGERPHPGDSRPPGDFFFLGLGER